MREGWQNSFYIKVGQYLEKARNRKGLTISQLATKSGEQFNTIEAIEKGKRFMFHQATWITEVLGISIDEMLDSINTITLEKGARNGKDKKEKRSAGIGDFI